MQVNGGTVVTSTEVNQHYDTCVSGLVPDTAYEVSLEGRRAWVVFVLCGWRSPGRGLDPRLSSYPPPPTPPLSVQVDLTCMSGSSLSTTSNILNFVTPKEG